MYYLGLDWGKNKCGLAIADKETLIANTFKQGTEADIYRNIFDFSQKEKIEKIIIGCHSDLLKNSKFKKFIKKIEQLKIAIELENEDFSTQIAQQNLINAQQKKISKRDDIESARVILQGWLDKRKNKC